MHDFNQLATIGLFGDSPVHQEFYQWNVVAIKGFAPGHIRADVDRRHIGPEKAHLGIRYFLGSILVDEREYRDMKRFNLDASVGRLSDPIREVSIRGKGSRKRLGIMSIEGGIVAGYHLS